MSTKLFRLTRLVTPSRPATPILSSQFSQHIRNFASTRTMAAVVDSAFISKITDAEKLLTKSDEPVKGGPTAQAQSHNGQELTSQVVHDITIGERSITGLDSPVQGGPTSIAQSILSGASSIGGGASASASTSTSASGVLDSSTISKITEKEKELTGQDEVVRRGPTAKAQQHAGQPITSEALHDITEGEKKITGGERVKGGPTSTAQSELAKSRQ
ncbi:hypothetical protein K491DRAFT_695120 [Lophiostoma macrostomum CBS 122681]|uniref:SMP domain-containing protein n=1 Tax=Lophiostoma macrostomum CBS 122681 TaxID=1314788 RepID=A0A6A6SZ52_9PLEO|nr:hypothetical protein K491DRAFT_695120 [Lophiostoma macrostomum CBS 122681]